MNEKITFPRLATMLADKSGRSKRFSEDFLREFFALISELLEAGESVKVKGLGTFRLSRVEPRRSVDVTTGRPMEISGHSKVVFIPSKELSEAVNAPFEAFTAIEISDDADLTQLFSKEDLELQEREDSEDEGLPKHNEVQGEEDTQATPESERANTIEDNIQAAEEKPFKSEVEERECIAAVNEQESPQPETEGSKEEPSAEEETDTEMTEAALTETVEEYDEYIEEEHSKRKGWVRILFISLGAAVVALIATFAVWYVFATNDFNKFFNRTAVNTTQTPAQGFIVGGKKDAGQKEVAPELPEGTAIDTLSAPEEPEVPTVPSDVIVYDTISTTRYLTTMAKAHYGNFNLWPYIYEENKSFLGHPDRIRPGTPVVIPKLSKYGVDPENKEDIEKAKKMGIEIYARYGKKI